MEDKTEDKTMEPATNVGAAGASVVRKPPHGAAVLMVLGPGLVWCGEYIGSGEVILATRSGAILGVLVLWVPIMAIISKYFIGLAGARYTVCTGEGMIDMLGRTPGPRNWVIWPVLVCQLCSAAIATGGLAVAAGKFGGALLPIHPQYMAWIISISVIAMVWGGSFDILKKIMSVLVAVIVIGVVHVAIKTWPGWGEVLVGAFGFNLPDVPAWALSEGETAKSVWSEVLPLLGWAAGGFASQVWYTYWVLGAGYGMAHGRGYGRPLDPDQLKNLSVEDAGHIKGWCRIVYKDASLGTCIGVIVTACFLIAGAGVLGAKQQAPEGEQVAIVLSQLFSDSWGIVGAKLFLLAGLAAMISTLLGQFAGWPRLLADCFRLLVPKVSEYTWKVQFRTILILLAVPNMILVYLYDAKPLAILKLGAVLDGLLLTPLQALAVGLTLYFVMPKFFKPEVRRILRPSPIFAVGLAVAFIMFGYFCVFQIPMEYANFTGN